MSLSRKPHALAAAIAVLLVLGGGFAAFGPQADAQATVAPPPSPVDVATVASRQITDWHSYSGRLEAVDRVEIRPLVSGTITAVHFQDGALVNKGDPLFTIDPRPYAAALEHARARLAAAEARAAYTAGDLARGERLIVDNAIARRDYEEKRNAAREADANRLAARAALESARLDLEYTRITAPIDVHLMVSPVDRIIGDFIEAGATYITFHPEASQHIDRSLQLIKDGGCKAGLVFNPATSLDALKYVMDKIDMVLLMSVNPGFGGQKFIPGTLDKLREARALIDASGRDIRLEIDGGVNVKNIREIAEAGADTFVAGSAIFNAPDYSEVIRAMHAELAQART